MAKHIGIVACSVEGAALCYRQIAIEAAQAMGEYDHPRVTMDSIAMAGWLDAFDRKDYKTVADIMLYSTNTVAAAGADFAICPDNSAHLAFPYLVPRSPIPWLHIADVVAAYAQRNGWKRSALLGTRYTMTGSVYPEAFSRIGMEAISPAPEDQRVVDEVIWQELVRGNFPEKSRLLYNDIIARMKQQHGCDSVILGCTEIPLLVHADDCPLPVLDSTRLLAKAAVERALA